MKNRWEIFQVISVNSKKKKTFFIDIINVLCEPNALLLV